MMPARNPLEAHLTHLADALPPYRRFEPLLARWGAALAQHLTAGGRLLVAGNGGSAAEAQHLTAELVGKLREDRQPLSAIALHAETSALTAIGNDYGYEEVFARQVRAHGRPDDVLLLLSTSGGSANLLAAARAGRQAGLRCWAFTGPAPNPLADACHEALAVDCPDSQVVQELHLVSSHLLCEYVERAMAEQPAVAAYVAPVVPAASDAPAVGPVRAGVEVVLDGGAGRPVEA
ncbi:D-sedoheptulose-7-phosphate isomerase [Micromonospora craniellae]|uniref:SIS domain-containing protein n=1 Tax=Micromonospora craniellae TaxID=2294034 RepID=A0A372G1N3_9ACTN|nr:SIS domain-containing protein [Micromonospora craniellae]QOC94824.1 SIS domain-containing protein [Micromonospora craniellae]RFS46967.1 SIS domain-containing protein [Micromonospora craniellae]